MSIQLVISDERARILIALGMNRKACYECAAPSTEQQRGGEMTTNKPQAALTELAQASPY